MFPPSFIGRPACSSGLPWCRAVAKVFWEQHLAKSFCHLEHSFKWRHFKCTETQQPCRQPLQLHHPKVLSSGERLTYRYPPVYCCLDVRKWHLVMSTSVRKYQLLQVCFFTNKNAAESKFCNNHIALECDPVILQFMLQIIFSIVSTWWGCGKIIEQRRLGFFKSKSKPVGRQDVRFSAWRSVYYGLSYFTGSMEFNRSMRTIAKETGYKLLCQKRICENNKQI